MVGTWLRAERAITSWNVTPANSGVRTVRTSPGISSSPGSASGSDTTLPTVCPAHRIHQWEHTFY
ncbi:hypothetical protein GCM10022197_35480 [Microlunatus spumicola]|uniref:Uncharacterized protein n=1 Tax=Microlunatus spumicola TaxID=81499 RepID=A0ABP6Y162_9ACTN